MADGGAWYLFLLENDLGVALRVAETDGQLKVEDVYVNAPHLTQDLLRSVPLARFEEMLNRLDRDELERSQSFAPDDDAPSFSDLHDMFGKLRASRPMEGEMIIAPWRGQRAKVTRPGVMQPEDFYRNVALAYQGYAAVTKAAAAKIAEEAGVPVTTAHRWVREARRRGFLPAGQKGKTG